MKTEQNVPVPPVQAGDVSPVGVPAKKSEEFGGGSKVTWGPWASVSYAVLVYYVANYAALFLLVAYPLALGWSLEKADKWLTGSIVAQFFYVLLAEGLTFGAIWLFIRHRKSSLRAIGWKKYRWWYPAAAVVAYAIYALCYGVLLGVASHADHSLNVHQKQDLGFQNVSGNLSLILTFFSLVVLPPLVEETVFRGFMFTGLRTKLKWVWAAIITSLLFASAHVMENSSGQPLLWVAGIDTFTLSMFLCYLRQKTDSIWPGVFLHALKNGVAFVSLFILHIS